jgi:DNA mismatch endonuclease, patch repair protein
MVDTLSKVERSERMSRIRGKDTKPELALRSAMHRLGFRFRLHGQKLPGRPDLVFPKYRAAVFVHGCFWHRHEGCKIATTPKSNTAYWQAKFNRNVERDARAARDLEAQGWRVFTVWECQVASGEKASQTAAALADTLRSELGRRSDALAHPLS